MEKTIKLAIGRPVEPMLVAESGGDDKKFAEILRKHKGKTFSEIKYDGYRIQAHKSSQLWLFTRNLNALNPEVFPEIKDKLRSLPDGIYDGELVGFDNGLVGFNAVKKRVRGELDSKLVKEYPLQIRFFDVLLLQNKVLADAPLRERRKSLEQYTGNISEQETITSPACLKDRFESVTSQGLEGLVCKNPESAYLIGKKTFDWVKLKKFLSLDLVVLGVYKGEGKAAELPFAALLLGTRSNGNYETITKVGISNKELVYSLNDAIKAGCISTPPRNVLFSEEIKKKTYARKIPFCYVTPEKSAVVEVECLNVTRSRNWHSCGLKDSEAYSMRIPVVRRIRNDKGIKDATTTEQVSQLYKGVYDN
ncbi:hypothetical protein HYT92_03860 [Candidatus Pacearchaeota archaeon]|nr:hypothetical protein [Candidatus Pacearchaeota archaeon]